MRLLSKLIAHTLDGNTIVECSVLKYRICGICISLVFCKLHHGKIHIIFWWG